MNTTPWHLWIIGIVTLLWNAMGAFDYVMTQTRNQTYLQGFTPEQLAYFQSFPTWVVAAWATAIWASVLGSILILMRNRSAAPILALAFFAMTATAIHNFGLAEQKMHEVTGPEAIWISLAIFVISLLMWLYARAMRQRGVLT